jgi:hypothetical protein
MKYIKAKWKHDFPDEPVDIYGELDDAGNEIRVVEVWRDGRMGYASESSSFGGSLPAEKPWPGLDDIQTDPEFDAEEISREEFERLWRQAITQNA